MSFMRKLTIASACYLLVVLGVPFLRGAHRLPRFWLHAGQVVMVVVVVLLALRLLRLLRVRLRPGRRRGATPLRALERPRRAT